MQVLVTPEEVLAQKIERKTARIGVVGLGYVGLPLLKTFHDSGFPVLGFDIDQLKVDAINAGISYIQHIGSETMADLARSDRAEATVDFSRVAETDAILICVPTPLTAHREPDMTYVEATARTIAPYLHPGQLVVLESTTYPGTTDELLRPLLEEGSGLQSGKHLFLAFSPEREDPGNPDFGTATIPKVVGGDGEQALQLACALYGGVISSVVPVSSTATAEAVKLLENIFRSVNIALVNELKVVFTRMGIDIYEVIDAARTKPFGFMPFYPGPGLGGHCIPIDPFYLTWKAREFGIHTRFIELAGEINTSMPDYVLNRTIEALNDRGVALKGSRVLCLGLAYKPDVDDDRESPTYQIMDMLAARGAHVDYCDPFIPVIKPSREHGHWAGLASVEWRADVIASYDVVLILTHHSALDYDRLFAWSNTIVDTRGMMRRLGKESDAKVWRA
jgi:UDP-N-acetyl-D-glucosamine dehydrogenase